MIKIRLISFFLVSTLFANLSCALFAMKYEEEIYDELNNSSTISMKKELEKTSIIKKTYCSHWGLSHWLSGITEYFQRCFCCGVPEDNERAFVITKGVDIAQSSDCCILGVIQLGTFCCDNPIGGTLCCPLATAAHLCCLPFVFCSSSQRTYRSSIYTPKISYNSHYSHPKLTQKSEEESIRTAYTIYRNDDPNLVQKKRQFRPGGIYYYDEK